MNHRTLLGSLAENFVASCLKKNGFTILEHNFRQRAGEIDLIALQGELLVFVEVKMRCQEYFDLSEVITKSKQHKIIATAKRYIAHHHYEEKVARFDVALVHGTPEMQCTYISNAFNESDCTW